MIASTRQCASGSSVTSRACAATQGGDEGSAVVGSNAEGHTYRVQPYEEPRTSDAKPAARFPTLPPYSPQWNTHYHPVLQAAASPLHPWSLPLAAIAPQSHSHAVMTPGPRHLSMSDTNHEGGGGWGAARPQTVAMVTLPMPRGIGHGAHVAPPPAAPLPMDHNMATVYDTALMLAQMDGRSVVRLQQREEPTSHVVVDRSRE